MSAPDLPEFIFLDFCKNCNTLLPSMEIVSADTVAILCPKCFTDVLSPANRVQKKERNPTYA
jgi:RNase P subunit RPR2